MADIRVEGVKRNSSGLLLMMLILLLFSIGFVTVMSVLSCSPTGNLKKQLFISGAALAIFAVTSSGLLKASYVDFFLKSKLPTVILIGTLLLAVYTFLFAENVNGAKRWIEVLGISVQSSEMLKVAVILFLSSFFADPRYAENEKKRHAVIPCVLAVCFCVVLLQHDFSTAVLIGLIGYFMMLFAGYDRRYMILIAAVGIVVSVMAIFGAGYRQTRFQDFITGKENYQSQWAIHAIENGGWLGCGWGAGTIKSRGVLPEAETDFIFAVLAEEIGFLGVLILISLMMIIGGKALFLADRVKNQPGRFFLVLGITFSFLSQTLMNLAVVVGLLPTTGVPLPLFSQGGSSLLCTMFMMGLLVHIARTAEENDG